MRSLALVALVWVVAGCGRFAFDPRSPDRDAPDVPLGMFAPPEIITELSTPSSEDDPALTGDLLEIFFDSDRPGGLGDADIYHAVRASVNDPWGPAMHLAELSTPLADLAPGITPDGLTIFVSAVVAGDSNLYVSTRPDRFTPFALPVQIAEVSSPNDDTNAQPSSNALELWFASRRGGAAMRQLSVATRADEAATWSPPIAINDLNVGTDIYTGDPWPSPKGDWLYFASDRVGSLGLKDIWRAPRLGATSFGAPEPIVEINSAQADQDPWLSPDLRVMYFSSRRGGGGDSDLYFTTR